MGEQSDIPTWANNAQTMGDIRKFTCVNYAPTERIHHARHQHEQPAHG